MPHPIFVSFFAHVASFTSCFLLILSDCVLFFDCWSSDFFLSFLLCPRSPFRVSFPDGPCFSSVPFTSAFRGFYSVSSMGLKGFSGPSEPPASPPTRIWVLSSFSRPFPLSKPVPFGSLPPTLSLSAPSPKTLTRLRSRDEGIWRKNERNTGFLFEKHSNCLD
ncbi:hypothetical protein NPIL_399471 [Nephila pilipes]|uniref:Uncharacterized protein n=1 Tax=Nephila pilipes TaxID=299642 RepID=A0A8X6NDL4_NEPPI|nr:hypothetical protein NPIL_399471 [Nephila pilipes]